MMYRQAVMDDADMLFRWRNDPGTFKYFRNNWPVTEVEHLAWLCVRISGDRPTFICFEDDHNPPVGVVQLTDLVLENGYEISLTVAPESRGQGLGAKILNTVCGDFPEATFYAQVKHDNKASAKSFEAAGFTKIGSDGRWIQWRRLPTK